MSPVSSTKKAESADIAADLILLHAPSVYDFRDRDDVLFAYLSDSDSVNVTSVYEEFPLGFFSICQHLRRHGMTAEIVNVASLMLMYPEVNVDRLLSHLSAPVFGIDLHWLCHCHGSIELAKRLKSIHPGSLVIFGGISATYYAQELIRYPCVDVVVRGFDALITTGQLVREARIGHRDFSKIPNLLYRDANGGVQDTGFTYKPAERFNDVATDWSWYAGPRENEQEPRLILTLPNTGCAHDCSWCGGSRFAYRKIMGIERTLVTKDHQHIRDELASMGDAAKLTSIYALGCYSETRQRLYEYLEAVHEFGYRSVHFEQFHLTSDDVLKKMAWATDASIMLSPESHDPYVSRLAGRGNYTMKDMEEWIPRALDAGIRRVLVWFFIGMPQQTVESVRQTVAYSESLLEKYRGDRVLPLICPMVPFVDPGSRIFEHPEEHGYTIFHRTLEEHRQAMVEPLWYRRLNYASRWLSRREIQDITYETIDRLIECKQELSILPRAVGRSLRSLIAETKLLLNEIEHAIDLDAQVPDQLRRSISHYNRRILAYASDQIVPMQRPFGGRWFDDFTVPQSIIARSRY